MTRRRPLVRIGRTSATGLGLALLAGPAFGYFAVAGSGTGSGTSGSLQALVIQPATTGTPASSLLPGATGDLLLNVKNPNTSPVTITAVSQSGGVSVPSGGGCTNDPGWPGSLGNSGVSVLAQTGLSIQVAGGATATVHLSGAASMDTTSASACQGAAFQIPIAVTVRQ